MSVVFPFAALLLCYFQYNFSEVFAEDVVGMQILREQDSISSGQGLLQNVLSIFWCASLHFNCPNNKLQSIAYAALVLTFSQHNTYLLEGMEKNLTFASSGYFAKFFCFWVLFLQLKAQQ